MLKKLKFEVIVEMKYHEYEDQSLNKEVSKQVSRYLKESIEHIHAFPFYVERDENGSLVESVTQQLKVRVKQIGENS